MLILLLLLAAPAPEECLDVADQAGVTVTHAGKSYRLANEECRAEFLSDPERFAQLYDALLELKAAGKVLEPPADDASLVPS